MSRINDIAEQCDFYVGNEHHDKSHEEKQRIWLKTFTDYIITECHDQMIIGGVDDLDVVLKHFQLENIKRGADIHGGDGGYSIGTEEEYNKFREKRSYSIYDPDRTDWIEP